MKPLIVLVVVFVVSLFIIKVTRGMYDYALAGTIALSVMLVFTSIAHFAFARGMTMMVPDFLPYKKEIVFVTGVIEIVAAIVLLIPTLRMPIGWFLVAFFILLLPANIYAAVKHIDYEKGTFEGNGAGYLWFRVPLQLLFIAWAYFSTVK